jgi:hypothetical protein
MYPVRFAQGDGALTQKNSPAFTISPASYGFFGGLRLRMTAEMRRDGGSALTVS